MKRKPHRPRTAPEELTALARQAAQRLGGKTLSTIPPLTHLTWDYQSIGTRKRATTDCIKCVMHLPSFPKAGSAQHVADIFSAKPGGVSFDHPRKSLQVWSKSDGIHCYEKSYRLTRRGKRFMLTYTNQFPELSSELRRSDGAPASVGTLAGQAPVVPDSRDIYYHVHSEVSGVNAALVALGHQDDVGTIENSWEFWYYTLFNVEGSEEAIGEFKAMFERVGLKIDRPSGSSHRVSDFEQTLRELEAWFWLSVLGMAKSLPSKHGNFI